MKQKSNKSHQSSNVKPLAEPEIPITTRFISLLTDYGFKGLLGNEQHKQLTIDFLNAVLQGKKSGARYHFFG